MKIETLKEQIENKSVGNEPLIFLYEDTNFIPLQYIVEIARIREKNIEYIDSLANIGSNVNDIFGGTTISNSLRVLITKELEDVHEKFRYETDLYIVVNKIKDKTCIEKLSDLVINIPKLEDWQIKDYVYSLAEGIDTKSLDWLIEATGSDIYRLENELDKFKLFQEAERKYLFEDMVSDGAFVDLSNFNVFNITNAVTSRDYNTLKNALKEIKSFDAEPLGVVTLLYNGFRKLILVWLANNPTTESTGLKSGMIWAIKNQPRVFTKEQLLSSFLLLTNIDKMLKTGYIDTSWLIDYLICRILTY